MGFFSRLFGSSAGSHQEESHQEESVLRIPWSSQTGTGDCELREAYVLVSDIAGLTVPDIAPIREKCKKAGRPLVLVTPGVEQSIVQLLGEGDTLAIKATPLPGQPLRGLLEDLAVITGGAFLCKPLGFGISFPDWLAGMAEKDIWIPRHSWEGLTLGDLGRVRRLLIHRDATEFRGPGGQRQVAEALAIQLLREEPTPGRDERFRRLCTAAGYLPDEAKMVALLHTDFSAEYPLGLASRYFVTDPNTQECRLDDASVAVFGEPLDDLQTLVRLLGRVAADGRPLLLVAPSLSDEALAICVVNKLRGIVLGAVAVPRTRSPGTAGMLADVARRTGAVVVARADSERLQKEALLAERRWFEQPAKASG